MPVRNIEKEYSLQKGLRYEFHTKSGRVYSGEYCGLDKCSAKTIDYVKIKGNKGRHIYLSELLITEINLID